MEARNSVLLLTFLCYDDSSLSYYDISLCYVDSLSLTFFKLYAPPPLLEKVCIVGRSDLLGGCKYKINEMTTL